MPAMMSATTNLGRVGIIGAAGWLGGAIAQSLLRAGATSADTGNEDALYAVVNFENGAIGNIDYSWAWPTG